MDKSPRAALGTKSDRPKERRKKTFCLAAKPLTFKLTTERRVDRLNDPLCSPCSHLLSTLTFPQAVPREIHHDQSRHKQLSGFTREPFEAVSLPAAAAAAGRLLLKHQTLLFFVFFQFQQLISCISSQQLNLQRKLQETRPKASLVSLHPPDPHPQKNLIWWSGRGIRSCQAEFRLSRSPSTRHRMAHFIHD